VTLGEGTESEVRARFAGYETNLPQESAVLLVGAHFEITSSGRSGRGALESLSEGLMIVVPAPAALVESLADTPGSGAAACGSFAGGRCFQAGDSLTTFRHRTSASDVSS
jgi:hypothetical protein